MNDAQRQRIEDAYAAAHIRATTLLEDLRGILGDMPAPEGDAQINWGHVGSLNYLSEQLAELKAHFTGK